MEIVIAILVLLVFAGGGQIGGIIPGSYGYGVGQVAPPPPPAPPTGSVLPTSTVPPQSPSSSSNVLPALASAGCTAAKIPGGACQLYASKLQSDIGNLFNQNAPGIFATLQQKAQAAEKTVSVAGPGGVSLWVGKPPGSTQGPPPRTAAAAAYPAASPGALSRNLRS